MTLMTLATATPSTHHRPPGSASLQVVLVTETFAPEVNGVAMTLGRLVEGLAERGHRIEVVRPRQPDEAPTALRPGIAHVLRPGMGIPRYQGLRLGMPSHRFLRARWREQRPDVVHIATEGPLGWSALNVACSMGIPVSTSFHTNFHDYSRHYGAGFLGGTVLWWLRRFHNRARVTMVPSADLILSLSARGFRDLRLLGRGVDTRLFDPARRDRALRRHWGASDQTLVVLHVGRLAPEKNIDLAVQAFRRLRLWVPDALMVITGDGPERSHLARSYPDVVLAAAQPPAELARFYASADCFLFPSLSETYGNVCAEAMASGLPVLAFSYAAPAKLIRDGVNGYLVPFSDNTAFIERACAIVRDREQLRRIGTTARDTTLALAWDTVVDRFASYLTAVACGLPLPDQAPQPDPGEPVAVPG